MYHGKEITLVRNHRLWTDAMLLRSADLQLLEDALCIPNVARAEAQRRDEWGWQDMPEKIAMHRFEEDLDTGHPLIGVPRGYEQKLLGGLRGCGYRPHVIDSTVFPQLAHRPLILRRRLYPWQRQQLLALMRTRQGIIKAPSGSGKTVSVLGAIEFLRTKTLIIVHTKDIMWQWMERVRDHLPGWQEPGQIGDDVFRIGDEITIATQQTLHRRFHALEDDGFFDTFGFVCLDEAHHATADTYRNVFDNFSARFRVGVSATPEKTGDFTLAWMTIGPIISDTKPRDVHTLMRPKVVHVPTSFSFPFVGHRSRWDRGNYTQMIRALVSDPQRNAQIVEQIHKNAGHHQLVISKWIDHLRVIESLLADAGFPDPIVTIIGKNDSQHRQQAKALAETSPCVILSTLADEAMDIPRLDRLHLIFPQRNTGLTTQQVGRAERMHPDKKDAIIYDYVDVNVGVLQSQFRGRQLQVYIPRRYELVKLGEWKVA